MCLFSPGDKFLFLLSLSVVVVVAAMFFFYSSMIFCSLHSLIWRAPQQESSPHPWQAIPPSLEWWQFTSFYEGTWVSENTVKQGLWTIHPLTGVAPANQTKDRAKTESSWISPTFVNSGVFSLGRQARFTSNFCSSLPPGKVHELAFLWFGLPGWLLTLTKGVNLHHLNLRGMCCQGLSHQDSWLKTTRTKNHLQRFSPHRDGSRRSLQVALWWGQLLPRFKKGKQGFHRIE